MARERVSRQNINFRVIDGGIAEFAAANDAADALSEPLVLDSESMKGFTDQVTDRIEGDTVQGQTAGTVIFLDEYRSKGALIKEGSVKQALISARIKSFLERFIR